MSNHRSSLTPVVDKLKEPVVKDKPQNQIKDNEIVSEFWRNPSYQDQMT